MFKDFPSLHPLAVHFPIVFIFLAAVFQAVVTLKIEWNQIRWAALFIMAAAFFSGLAAATIFHAHPSADAPKAAMEVFEEHEKYAQFTLWTSGITLLLKSIDAFFKINRRSYDILVLSSAFSALIFVSITGHHGARLTHIEGVGPMGRYLMKGHDMHDGDMKNKDQMEMVGDSAMKMNEKMPGMDTMKNMKGMDGNKGPGKKSGMNMMKEKDQMKNMPGMGKTKNKREMPDMKDMKKMPGMDSIKSKESMNNMKDMPGMDSTLTTGEMNNMKLPVKNAINTLRFPDNNPALKRANKRSKQ